MIYIAKDRAPDSLTEYKKQPNAEYDGANFTEVKDDIRKHLLTEQYYLCAYCMRRIYDDRFQTKIEHWHCQDNHEDERLEYKNMLAVCYGNEGQKPTSQHCDTKKGNKELKYNPSKFEHRIEDKIKYLSGGKIESNESDFNEQLNSVLNLNMSTFKENREAIYIAIRDALGRKSGRRTKAEIQKEIDKWKKIDSSGHKKEYRGVAIYFLNKKLKSCP